MEKLMKLFSFLKKDKKEPEKPRLNREQQMSKDNAIRLHKIRISNLNDEFEELASELEIVEANFDQPQAKRDKSSDTIIRRMSILKYEIEIREGLVKWLS
jgi:hypothetical protein